MHMLYHEIMNRVLPDLFTHINGSPVIKETWEMRRTELKEVLSREIYGYAPPAPTDTSCVPERADDNLCAGKVRGEWFDVAFSTPVGKFSFPVCLFIPKHSLVGENKPPLILHLNFRPDVPDKYFPLEEITDAGFAAAQIYYQDITSDDGDFTTGLAAHYPKHTDRRTPHAWGKLRMWAFAASRALDVLVKRTDIDVHGIIVAGHSRLGKTALLAAAEDERFAGAISNDSGCSGAAITRDKTGERVQDITKNFPYWFCPQYQTYVDREYDMPFDQHFLCALLAPRFLCIGSAWEDSWADPASEWISAVLASRIYPFLDGNAIPAYDELWQDNGQLLDRYPCAGESYVLGGGRVHYHLRSGTHYFSREDWNQYLAFFAKNFFELQRS